MRDRKKHRPPRTKVGSATVEVAMGLSIKIIDPEFDDIEGEEFLVGEELRGRGTYRE